MQINKTASDLARAEAMQRSQTAGTNQGSTAPVSPVSEVSRSDAVQISDAGRALSGSAPRSDGSAVSALDPRRADEIRSNILSGAYNSLEMADQVARSLMRSGDL